MPIFKKAYNEQFSIQLVDVIRKVDCLGMYGVKQDNYY